MSADPEVTLAEFEGYRSLRVNAGYRGTKRVVPPAGEEHAFDVKQWRRRVEVCVSPKGRSVRVFVDGVESPLVVLKDDSVDIAFTAPPLNVREQRDEAVALLRRVRADRPSAHNDALWGDLNDFLAAFNVPEEQ